MHASDVIDLPELAARQGWTIAAAREIVRRSARRRADGLHARPSDPPPPLRLVAGKSPIWDRFTIERWEWQREQARTESGPDDSSPSVRCKQCQEPMPDHYGRLGGRPECATCAGLEHPEDDE